MVYSVSCMMLHSETFRRSERIYLFLSSLAQCFFSTFISLKKPVHLTYLLLNSHHIGLQNTPPFKLRSSMVFYNMIKNLIPSSSLVYGSQFFVTCIGKSFLCNGNVSKNLLCIYAFSP